MSWNVFSCSDCGKSDKFIDTRAIIYSKWKIIAWIVPSGDPMVICPECNAKEIKKKKN